jgi:hypothetical protein
MNDTTISLPRGERRARRRHATSFSDAVVAAYIHDISGRRQRPRGASYSPGSSASDVIRRSSE